MVLRPSYRYVYYAPSDNVQSSNSCKCFQFKANSKATHCIKPPKWDVDTAIRIRRAKKKKKVIPGSQEGCLSQTKLNYNFLVNDILLLYINKSYKNQKN